MPNDEAKVEAKNEPRCPECGYTDNDAILLGDHYCCKNYPFFDREKRIENVN